MKYSETIVDNKHLKNDVLCYWQMNGSIPNSESITSRYIPKGQSLLIFNFGNEIHLPNKTIDSCLFVVPAIKSSLIINQTGNINLFGVSFIGDGLFKLLEENISQFDEKIPFELNKKLKKLYDEFKDLDFKTKGIEIESFLLKHLNTDLKSLTFDRAICLINNRKGIVKIERISESLGVSSRYLQRLFKTRLGLSPKVYCKITRVNNYINFILESSKPIDWMDIVVDFNYHDQSHFINEIKAISKLSPSKLLKYRDTLFHLYQKG